jgi:flagellin
MGASLARIAANVPAMQNINTLNKISDKISGHQLRLATGKRINSPGEDPAGYMLARGLESRRRGLSVALDNVSNAQNILDVAEGGYSNVMDILQTAKEKATQAADGGLSSTQRAAIHDQVNALITEVDEIVTATTFNGSSLIDGTFSSSFQTGELASETLSVALQDADSAALSVTVASDQATASAINLQTQASANSAITSLSTAIDTLSDRMKDVGEYKVRLQSKEANLSNAVTNTEAVRSTIEDADFAKEQMEVMKLQILQQTSLSSLTQSNSAPQLVLSMFR